MKFVCGMQINKVFYKLILSFWVWVTRHAKSAQNKKFVYLCNIQKSMGDEVAFLRSDKHKSFLRVGRITLGVRSQACTKYPKHKFPISQGKCEGLSSFFSCR